MARSDLMKFWKLLEDAKITGQPSKLTEDDIRRMGEALALPDQEIGAAIRGLIKFKNQDS